MSSCTQGFGLGGNLAVDFAIFLENVPTILRGRLTTLLTIFATLGSLSSAGLAVTPLPDKASQVPDV
jgi:MFS family permease